jgi:hypothetical protein
VWALPGYGPVRWSGRPTSQLSRQASAQARMRQRELTSETVSAILSLVATTANLRRAMDETVSLFSMSDAFAPISEGQLLAVMSLEGSFSRAPRIPMSYSLLSISDSFCCLKGSSAGSRDIRLIRDLIEPHSLLYLRSVGVQSERRMSTRHNNQPL